MNRLLFASLIVASVVSVVGADEPKPTPNRLSPNIAAGTVTRVDAEKKLFEIKAASDKTLAFTVNERTKFTRDDKEISLADLAVGNYLRFTFAQSDDGTSVARRVFVSEKTPVVDQPQTPQNETPPEQQ